jgi:hypothetical protein
MLALRLDGNSRLHGQCLDLDQDTDDPDLGVLCRVQERERSWPPWRGKLRRRAGGAAFILSGLIVILALAALLLSTSPPLWVLGGGAGAGAAVPAVAVHAGTGLIGASWQRRKQTVR